MNNLDLSVLEAVGKWSDLGHSFALVTVARTWGSAPRLPGAWLALRDDGLVQGSVSGGCVEADLIECFRTGRHTGVMPYSVSYGGNKIDADRFGLPCGGTLELVVEPAPDRVQLRELGLRITRGEMVRRTINLENGETQLGEATRSDGLEWDGKCLTTIHGPRQRLLIIGAGQTSHYLAQMAPALDFAVTVCDPREEYASQWNEPASTLRSDMPDDCVTTMALDCNSAVVALTHDPKLDDMALIEALKSPAFYVGALGSRTNNARRRERLAQGFDLSAEQLGRLHGPVGLPIGSRTPPEIAVAILAEITAVIHGVRLVRVGGDSDTVNAICETK